VPGKNDNRHIEYQLPNNVKVSLFFRDDSSGIITIEDIKLSEIRANKIKKRKEELAKREKYKQIQNIESLDEIFGIKVGVPVEDIIALAKKLKVNYKIKNILVATDRVEFMSLDDSLDVTSASVTHDLMLFDKVVYQVKSRMVKHDYIKYITNLLDSKFSKEKGRRDLGTGRVDNRYSVYKLPNKIVVSILNQTIIIEDINLLKKVENYFISIYKND